MASYNNPSSSGFPHSHIIEDVMDDSKMVPPSSHPHFMSQPPPAMVANPQFYPHPQFVGPHPAIGIHPPPPGQIAQMYQVMPNNSVNPSQQQQFYQQQQQQFAAQQRQQLYQQQQQQQYMGQMTDHAQLQYQMQQQQQQQIQLHQMQQFQQHQQQLLAAQQHQMQIQQQQQQTSPSQQSQQMQDHFQQQQMMLQMQHQHQMQLKQLQHRPPSTANPQYQEMSLNDGVVGTSNGSSASSNELDLPNHDQSINDKSNANGNTNSNGLPKGFELKPEDRSNNTIDPSFLNNGDKKLLEFIHPDDNTLLNNDFSSYLEDSLGELKHSSSLSPPAFDRNSFSTTATSVSNGPTIKNKKVVMDQQQQYSLIQKMAEAESNDEDNSEILSDVFFHNNISKHNIGADSPNLSTANSTPNNLINSASTPESLIVYGNSATSSAGQDKKLNVTLSDFESNNSANEKVENNIIDPKKIKIMNDQQKSDYFDFERNSNNVNGSHNNNDLIKNYIINNSSSSTINNKNNDLNKFKKLLPPNSPITTSNRRSSASSINTNLSNNSTPNHNNTPMSPNKITKGSFAKTIVPPIRPFSESSNSRSRSPSTPTIITRPKSPATKTDNKSPIRPVIKKTKSSLNASSTKSSSLKSIKSQSTTNLTNKPKRVFSFDQCSSTLDFSKDFQNSTNLLNHGGNFGFMTTNTKVKSYSFIIEPVQKILEKGDSKKNNKNVNNLNINTKPIKSKKTNENKNSKNNGKAFSTAANTKNKKFAEPKIISPINSTNSKVVQPSDLISPTFSLSSMDENFETPTNPKAANSFFKEGVMMNEINSNTTFIDGALSEINGILESTDVGHLDNHEFTLFDDEKFNLEEFNLDS